MKRLILLTFYLLANLSGSIFGQSLQISLDYEGEFIKSGKQTKIVEFIKEPSLSTSVGIITEGKKRE